MIGLARVKEGGRDVLGMLKEREESKKYRNHWFNFICSKGNPNRTTSQDQKEGKGGGKVVELLPL